MHKHFKIIQNLPTPAYFYDIPLLRATLESAQTQAQRYGYHIHYALKANANQRILDEIRKQGFGADCVSGNEVQTAINAGFPSEKIVFAGVGKTDKEINTSLDNHIFCFNVESLPEMEIINQLATAKGVKAPIALRLNPNVNANTHKYITTGLDENKFGIHLNDLDQIYSSLKRLQNLELKGLHFHIGSQITDMSTFINLCTRINEIQKWFFRHHIIVEHINVGGGLGVNYQDPDQEPIVDFTSFFELFYKHLELHPNQTLHFELGRCLVAQSGTLLSRVLYVKEGTKTSFVILDAGMTELIRPALYQSVHCIQNLSSKEINEKKYDVVGPICESSDCFGKGVLLNTTSRNDLIAIRSTGAYGEVMASSYNLRDRAQAFYSDELTHASQTSKKY